MLFVDAAKRIRAYIEANGLKQYYVAEKAGISFPAFNAILNGQTKLSVERLEKIAKALNVEVPELFVKQRESFSCPHCGKTIIVDK